MMEHEVTREQWEALHYANSLSTREERTPCYVLSGCDGVAGQDSVTCEVVTFQDGDGSAVDSSYACVGYRLPSEAEAEYAHRAGTTSALDNGDITTEDGSDPKLDEIGWYDENSGGKSHPVKGKTPNAWGLYGMSGNVWEMTWDLYKSEVATAAVTDPHGPSTDSFLSTLRARRGGSWYSPASSSRSANREGRATSYANAYVGFRVVRTAP